MVLDSSDNVCTVLADAFNGDMIHLNGGHGTLRLSQGVRFGHKAALKHIRKNERIVKYGQAIGTALCDIEVGEWVHLHNMTSIVDPDFRRRLES